MIQEPNIPQSHSWKDKVIQLVLIFILIAVTFLPFVLASKLVDIHADAMAVDWRNHYHGAIWREPLGGFWLPPYAIPYLIPITALSYELGWSLILYITALAFISSVPRKLPRKRWIIAILLLCTSFLVMRTFADANVEGFVVLGLTLSQYAFSKKRPYLLGLAVLMAAVKPQVVSLVMLSLAVYILREFNWGERIRFGAVVLLEVGITMLLWGRTWFGFLMLDKQGISLRAELPAYGIPSEVILALQIAIALISLGIAFRGKAELSHLKIGFLVTASLLMAPYFGGLSIATVLAFGGVGLFIKRPWLGVVVFMVYNLPYINAFGDELESLVLMALLFPLWLILGFELYREDYAQKPKLIHYEVNKEEK